MGETSETDLAQRALDLVLAKKVGRHVNLDDVTLKGIAGAATKGAVTIGLGNGVKAALFGPGTALAGALSGAVGGAVTGAASELWDKTRLEDVPVDAFDLKHPGAPSHFGELDADPGNPFGSQYGQRALASDILDRALRKDDGIRRAVADAVKRSAAELQSRGVSASAAAGTAAMNVRKDLVDRIAAKVGDEYDKNMGGARLSSSMLRPQIAGPEPALPARDIELTPQTAMPEPALPRNAAPATGDRPGAVRDEDDEFLPREIRPGRRPYDTTSPIDLLRGLR